MKEVTGVLDYSDILEILDDFHQLDSKHLERSQYFGNTQGKQSKETKSQGGGYLRSVKFADIWTQICKNFGQFLQVCVTAGQVWQQ